jgi:zinc transport system substrate-binding protein
MKLQKRILGAVIAAMFAVTGLTACTPKQPAPTATPVTNPTETVTSAETSAASSDGATAGSTAGSGIAAATDIDTSKITPVSGRKLNVVTTNFPPYDFVRAVGGDKVNLKMLLPPAAESHSFEPTPQDIIAIKDCDVFIYAGGESDSWVDGILESMDTSKMTIISMIDLVDAKEEELVEGMEPEKEEETENAESPSSGGEEHEYDEHVWTSPANAELIVHKIDEVLEAKDPANADTFKNKAGDYINKIRDIDNEFKSVVQNGKRKTIVFGDRFPFRYFADEYGLTYFAAFPGCSTETEPSVQTVNFLINKIKEEKIPVVFHIELSNEKMADTIAEATGAKKLLLNACHNISKEDFEKGVTYVDIMKQNVSALREALN